MLPPPSIPALTDPRALPPSPPPPRGPLPPPSCAALQVSVTQPSCLVGCFSKGWMRQPRGTKLQRGGTHWNSLRKRAAAKVCQQAQILATSPYALAGTVYYFVSYK